MLLNFMFVSGQRTYMVCQFDQTTLKSSVEGGWDINSTAFSSSGKSYPYILGELFNPKCIKESGHEFDRDMAYYYISNGGLIDIGSLRKIYKISEQKGDKPMMDLISIQAN
ncbi:hypothetical protein [Mesorhizobium sp.]|uniref:hypothetical protein n=1 Tax=Mesorhizobium sp. TaxID=1871066 RepID=UPI000FE522AA|nr:hypothetical protein [Mesorhizobium sp.]RWC55162.1 MAG: hypothetical protein EOS56_27185 [Mesorhizobium sp.]RWC60150.1 MAG: hypothetical protein EOS29_20775 [Mesorhizobium sp.]